jgi:hypothetical protein
MSWQIVPAILGKLMSDQRKRRGVMQVIQKTKNSVSRSWRMRESFQRALSMKLTLPISD